MPDPRIAQYFEQTKKAGHAHLPVRWMPESIAHTEPQVISDDWVKSLAHAVEKIEAVAASIHHDPPASRIEVLEREVSALKERITKLESGFIIVPIETLSPEPFVLKRTFHVVVCPSVGEFTATFFDANLCMSGDTEEEAVSNLKAVIVDTLEQFEQNESILGPEPARQLVVLREFIQKQV